MACTSGLRPVHTRELAPAARSCNTLPEQTPSSAQTICSEKICCATKLLLPSFAPSYQTGLICGSKLQGQICCTILFQEQAPSCVLKFALRERVSGASSLVCTGWSTYPGTCFGERVSGAWLGSLPGNVFHEQAPSCVLVGVLTRERVSGTCFRSNLRRVYRPLYFVAIQMGRNYVHKYTTAHCIGTPA